MTTTAQVAAVASLGDSAEIARRRGLNTEGLDLLTATLRAHSLDPAPGAVGNFLYVEAGPEAAGLVDRLLRAGVIVRPLPGFGAPTAIRISVGTPEENEFFAAALARVVEGDPVGVPRR